MEDGWNGSCTAYCCADGTCVQVKRQTNTRFMRKDEINNCEILVAVGPRNGVVSKIMDKMIKE